MNDGLTERIRDAMAADPAFAAAFLTAESPAAAAAVAADFGVEVAPQVLAAMAAADDELGDDELASATGGTVAPAPSSRIWPPCGGGW